MDQLFKISTFRFFFHLLPKGSSTQGGIKSLEWYYWNDRKMFRKYSEKYINRLCGGWGIYPENRINDLSDEEIFNGINQFRNSKSGCNQIYLFRYPPYKSLGPKMKKILETRDLYVINIDNKVLRSKIVIDWGYENSFTGGTPLTEDYYRSITKEEYFSKYTESESNRLLFSYLNHISISPENLCIPERYCKKIKIPNSIEQI